FLFHKNWTYRRKSDYKQQIMRSTITLLFCACCIFFLHTAHATDVGLQEQVVRGLVTDSTGRALSGVSVVVKDKSGFGTTTDNNGRYILDVPADAVLVFSMVGYVAQEVSAQNRSI